MKGKAASAHLKRILLSVALAAGLLAGPFLQGPSSAFAASAAAHPAPGRANLRTPAPVKLPPSSGEPAAKQPKKLLIRCACEGRVHARAV